MDRADLAVEQWARERPDLRTLPMALFGRLNQKPPSGVMREHMNPLFARAENCRRANSTFWRPCAARGISPYTLSPTQLYEAAMISSGGMTDRIDRLERTRGSCCAAPDPKDRRGKLIVLTEPGKRLIGQGAIGRHVANEERLLLSLTQAEQETLDALPQETDRRALE